MQNIDMKQCGENVNSLDNLLTLAKKEIQKTIHVYVRYVRASLVIKKKLLGKIDMSVQRDTLLMLKTQWDSAIEILKKRKMIIEWAVRTLKHQ